MGQSGQGSPHHHPGPLHAQPAALLRRSASPGQTKATTTKPCPSSPRFPSPPPARETSAAYICYPKIGALVELGFILGQPNKPFIRTVLIEGATVPALQANDVLLSKDASNHYRIDSQNNIAEHCQAVAERIAAARQRLIVENGGTVWVGNESDNVLQLLSDLMGEVIAIANALAVHTHGGVQTGGGSTAAPNNAGTYLDSGEAVNGLKGTLDGIKE